MKKYTKRPLMIAALAALMVFFMGCAVVYGLKDLKVGQYTPPTVNGETQVTEAKDMISLQGFAGSDSFKATKEWMDFEESYDPDGERMLAADQAGYAAPAAYGAYNCYTQDMIDKVDVICKKYDLHPLGRVWMETDYQKLFQMLGIPGITASNAKANFKWYSGYYFETGTFAIEMDAFLAGTAYGIQYRSSMKDTLDYVHLNVGDVNSYQQWNYAMPDGTTVLLALSSDKALILADRDSFFASVNILDPNGMTKETLEALAASFDFSYQPQKVDPAKADARQAEEEAEFMAQQESLAEQAENWTTVDSFAQLVANRMKDYKDLEQIENMKILSQMQYAFADISGDGETDLLIGQDGWVVEAYSMVGGKTHDLLVTPGSWLCEDGILDNFADYVDGQGLRWIIHDFYRADRDEDRTVLRVAYNGFSDRWEKNTTGYSLAEEILTEAEAMEIINSYPRVELDWKPITEFPMN